MKRKFEKHRFHDSDVSIYNKGQRRADGTMHDRFFVCTKRKVGATKLRSAVFSSEEEAKQFIPCFIAELNNERMQPIRDAKVPIGATSPPKVNTSTFSMDGLNKVLHDNRRQIKEEGVKKRAHALHCELRKITRAPAGVVKLVADEFSTCLKANTSTGVIANLVESFCRADRVTRDQDIQRRAFKRDKKCMKLKCSSYPYYEKKRHDILMVRLRKWISARDHLAPFIAKGHTEGLVCAVDGIDLTDTGNTKILRKATLVHMYCSLRLLGTPRDDAEEIACTTFPLEARMKAPRTLRKYVAEYFELTGFRETAAGKYVRQHVFQNAPLMFAMKQWLQHNEYKVLTSSEDPQDRKYFVAQHATDHLNYLLRGLIGDTTRCHMYMYCILRCIR
jgi:hypothetical protein